MTWGLIVFMLGLLVLCAPFALAAWVVLPLDRAARYRVRPLRFTTLDFLGLVFVIQLPLGLLQLAFPNDADKGMLSLPAAFCMMISGLIWWTGVQMFSRAGITNPKHRATLIFFVIPVAYFSPLVSISLTGLLLLQGSWREILTGRSAAALATICILNLTLWHAGWVSRRVVAARDAAAR